jgi:hypothetical protein
MNTKIEPLFKENTPNTTPISEIPVNLRSDFPYIIAGGFMLATCAGFVNVISILSSLSFTVSHNTGVASKMAINFTRFHWSSAGFQAAVLVFYVLGSTFIGAVIGKQKFHYSRKYGILLIIESIFLAIVGSFNNFFRYGITKCTVHEFFRRCCKNYACYWITY